MEPMRFGVLTLGDNLPDPNTGKTMSVDRRYRQIVDLAVRAEALGFDGFYVGEHHFCDYVISSPAVLLASIAERTSRLRLGTGVALLANQDPVRIAEDYATLDVLSGGRVELVVGRGLLRRTYVDFGQDPDASREIFDEKLDLLTHLWSDETVSWSGRHRSPLDTVALEPRPLQRPCPPVWIAGGTSFGSVDAAAARGLGLILPTLIPPPAAFRPLASRYREAYAASGHDPAAMRMAACSHVHVAATSQQAKERWRPYHMNYWSWLMETLMPWGGMNVGPGRSTFTTPSFDDLIAGPSICGGPAEVADRIGELSEMLGLDMYLAMVDHGGMPPAIVDESLTLLATEVLPKVRAG
jgi:alkanesulfonate monooxygenase SsuD/methylene tetrahydromethanopterin reductase-like flavin-dependent oxidoreductase (luciferase family)